MPAKRPFAAVFIHGLAKKPSPEKLQEIWLWGLGRDNPMPTLLIGAGLVMMMMGGATAASCTTSHHPEM